MATLTINGIKKVTDELREKITKNHIGNITLINSHDMFMTFSNYRKEKLLISLNPANPFVSLININNPTGTKVSKLSDTLRKEIKDGYILNIDVVNNDRVISIEYVKTNDYYEKEKKKIVVELIPHRPNFIILNEEGIILFATHYTDVLNEHPIIKGMKYQLLTNNVVMGKDDFDLNAYKKDCEKYYQESLRTRLKEQFKPVLQHIKSRIKTLNKKALVLNAESKTANDNLINQEIGAMILTYANDEESLNQYIADNNIEYDSSLTPGVNAEKKFAKYKKAKRTISQNEIELEKTKNEIAYLESCLAQSKYMNEDDIRELANLLFPHKFKANSKNKQESKPGEVSVDGTIIYFGKNAKQNDLLTFKKAQKKYWFFHIKDTHGSHVIVANENPSKEMILTACELALLLSQKDCGDVQATQVMNIKKGPTLGQALLNKYETYTIKQIREKTADLLNF